MIVNYRAEGWEIVTQRTHALLALQLALRWEKADRHKRWPELLVAIADHDDAQIELERSDLLSSLGGPLDFKMREFKLEHGERTIEFALSKSRYVALMCSIHLEFIAGNSKLQSLQVRKFLADQRVQRATWRKQLHLSAKEVKADYRLLEWCDALSLLICQRENQPEEREVEISQGPDDIPYYLSQPEPGILCVEPWPFSVNEFEVRMDRRELHDLKFAGCDEFKKAFMSAFIQEKIWKIKKSS